VNPDLEVMHVSGHNRAASIAAQNGVVLHQGRVFDGEMAWLVRGEATAGSPGEG